MHKFFVDKIIGINEKLIRISGEDKRHMSGPLRMVPGESVEIGDSAGTRFVCKITGYEKDTALLEVISFSSGNSEPPMDIWIFQGLPKSDKMDTIVQKCTELGAVRIVPVMCSRSISRFRNEEDKKKKTARWSKIAREAAKQCGRDRIPEVGQPLSLDDAVSEAAKADLCFIP